MVYTLLIFAGISCIFGSVITSRETKNFLKKAVHTEGTVLEVKKSSSDILFRTPETSITFETPVTEYEQGERVEVVYDPSHPTTAYINSFWKTKLQSSAFFLLGILFLCTGTYRFAFFFWYKKRLSAIQQKKHTLLKATVIRIEEKKNTNKKIPLFFRVLAISKETAPPCYYLSPALFEPIKYFTLGQSIDVYIDFDNPKVYAMDIPHFSEMI